MAGHGKDKVSGSIYNIDSDQNMSYYTYILKSQKDGRRYIGYTRDLERRLNEHNEGLTDATKNRRPLILVWSREFETEIEARRFEQYLKKLKGGNEFKKIVAMPL